MKKNYLFAGIVLLGSFAFASCQKEVEKNPIEVTELQDAYSFTADLSQKETFTVKSDIPWEISFDNLDWCDITPWKAIGGTTTVTIAPDNNSTVAVREGSFTIKAEGFTKTVTVSQLGQAPALLIESAATLTCSFTGSFPEGSDVISINANCDWKLHAPDWVEASLAEGHQGVTKVQLKASENQEETERTGVVKVTYEDVSAEVSITQEAKPAAYLEVENTAFSVGEDGGSVKIVVSSNTDWTVSTADAWLTLKTASGNGNAEIEVTAAGNGPEAREGIVELTTPAGLKQTVKITQKEKIMLDENDYIEYVVGAKYVWNTRSKEYTPSPEWPDRGFKASNPSPMNGDKPLVWLEWIKADNGKEYASGCKYSTGRMQVITVYTGDGFIFHLPVKKVEVGRNITLTLNIKFTGTKPKYWLVQYSLDEGKNWINVDTGHMYTTPVLHEYANVEVVEKSVEQDHVFNCPITETIDHKDIMIRFMTPDGQSDINGSDPSELPASSGNCQFGSPSGYNGPTIEFK